MVSEVFGSARDDKLSHDEADVRGVSVRCQCEEEHTQSTSHHLHGTFLQGSDAGNRANPQQEQEPEQNPDLAEP
jgi:hypothetical protein